MGSGQNSVSHMVGKLQIDNKIKVVPQRLKIYAVFLYLQSVFMDMA